MLRGHHARETILVIRRFAALLVLLGASEAGLAYNIYKSVDAQGNVTYSSRPLADASAVERVNLPPAPSEESVASAVQREKEIAAAGDEISKERQSLDKGVNAARREVNQAQAALADAKVMQDNDWQGTIQGKRHLKPEYFQRVAAAEARLEASEKAYKTALALQRQ